MSRGISKKVLIKEGLVGDILIREFPMGWHLRPATRGVNCSSTQMWTQKEEVRKESASLQQQQQQALCCGFVWLLPGSGKCDTATAVTEQAGSDGHFLKY